MPDALIGGSGFVGGSLLRQTAFDDLYRSSNIEEIRGRRYDLVVCAGAPAEKWKANREPERDRENLERLMRCLADVRAGHVVLISTVDVYASPVGVDEQTPIDEGALSAYGRHRWRLERFVRERFATTCVRLPGLFGRGLKKNVIFDLLHGNAVDAICPASEYQFYPLDRLWRDIQTARRNALELVNLPTEPVRVRDVARVAFDVELPERPELVPVRYDMRTRHAALFGGAGSYLETRARVLEQIREFASAERQRA